MKQKHIILLTIILLFTISLKGQNIDSLKIFIKEYTKHIHSHINKRSKYINEINNIPFNEEIVVSQSCGEGCNKYRIFNKCNFFGETDISITNYKQNYNLFRGIEYPELHIIGEKYYSISILYLKNKAIYIKVSIIKSIFKIELNSKELEFYIIDGKLVQTEKNTVRIKNKTRFFKKLVKIWRIKV